MFYVCISIHFLGKIQEIVVRGTSDRHFIYTSETGMQARGEGDHGEFNAPLCGFKTSHPASSYNDPIYFGSPGNIDFATLILK